MSSEIKLLPCPCCNAKARVVIPARHYFTFYQVVCTECGLASTATSTVDRTVEFWNTRKAFERISALYEDCENGAENDVVLGWNKALDKVIETIKDGGKNE